MEQKPSNINLSGLSLYLGNLLCGIRIKGFLSILILCLQCLWNWASENWKSWAKRNNPEQAAKQSSRCIEDGVRLCKEEVIAVMEKLGISVERGGDGIEDFGEGEISEMFENEATVAELEEAFHVFDENKDGFIDATELRRVLCCLGLEKDFVQCQKMIHAVDQNGDQLIDHAEFVLFMEQSFC
ncbi:probable calcium-binding protein CML45 [Abrus precatorius]|uniref:Probable calcium-binding protein CML45 n=1 Tax=Abrus precatorius TaxID=3816 RepID=A0A8B8KZ52_ABRPR|nr:probable calcium-binding protein CML45 [Abrus precatorius]